MIFLLRGHVIGAITKSRFYSRYPVVPMSDRAVVRFQEDRKKVTLSLLLSNDVVGGRKINLCRNSQENGAEMRDKLLHSINKAVAKKKKRKKKDSDQESQIDHNFSVTFSRHGMKIDEATLNVEQLFSKKTDLQLEISLNDETVNSYYVDVDPPIVDQVKLNPVAMAGFASYPIKLKTENCQEKDVEFEWFVGEEPNWSKKQEGFIFAPDIQDVGKFIKLVCSPRSGSRKGIPYEVISKNPIEMGPGKCLYKDRHKFGPNPGQLRMVTYNILADLYADSEFSRTVLFPQCPGYAMDIGYRKSLIIDELMGYDGDILCLQEVDQKVFKHDLEPVLKLHGYDGDFSLKGGKVSEGLACFWKNEEFKMLENHRFVIHDSIENEDMFGDLKRAVDRNEKTKASLRGRTTILKIVVLELLQDPLRKIIVGITHLYFKPDADHIRLVQTATCMGHLESVKLRFPTAAVFLVGDFNSTPPFGVLEYIRKGHIDKHHPDWKSNPEEEIQDLCIEHPFQMDTACGTPEFTTYTVGFKDCLDYIFYETDKFKVEKVLPFPLREELEELQGLPHISYPSDHIACVADLSYIH